MLLESLYFKGLGTDVKSIKNSQYLGSIFSATTEYISLCICIHTTLCLLMFMLHILMFLLLFRDSFTGLFQILSFYDIHGAVEKFC